MGRTVDRSVEIGSALSIRVLGPVTIRRNGEALPMPRSRKVRALVAFLAVGSGPFTRARLCDLLWDVPNDPRGELRWCLSKLRNLLDDKERRRVVTVESDRIALDLSDCFVDALEIDRVVGEGLGNLSTESLAALCQSFGGDLLEGLQIDGSPE